MANMWEGWEGMSQSLEADSATKLNKQKADSYNKEQQGRALFGQVIQRLKPGPDGTYDMKAIVQGLQQAGAGSDPQLIASALEQAMPFMNAQSQMAYKQWQQQLGFDRMQTGRGNLDERINEDKIRNEQRDRDATDRNERHSQDLQVRRDNMQQRDEQYRETQARLRETASVTQDLAKKRLILSEMSRNESAHANYIRNNIQAGSSLMATPAEKQQWMEENKAYIQQADQDRIAVEDMIKGGGSAGGATPGNTPTSTPAGGKPITFGGQIEGDPPSVGDPNNGVKWTTPPPAQLPGQVPPGAPLGGGTPGGNPVPPQPGPPLPSGGGPLPGGGGNVGGVPPGGGGPPQAGSGGRPLDPKLQADFKEAVGLGYPAAPIIQHFKSQGFDVSGLGG